MKRSRILLLAGAAGVFASVLAVSAQSWSDPQSCPASTACRPCGGTAGATASKPAKPASNDPVIEDLMAILKETKSTETFIFTTLVLGRMGPEARRALPTIIRTAERLEMLEELFDPSGSDGERVIAKQVMSAIESMAEPRGTVRVWQKTQLAPTCAPGAPATSYGSPVPVYYPPPAPAAGRNDSAVGLPQQYPMSYGPIGATPAYPVSGTSVPPQPSTMPSAPVAQPSPLPLKPVSGSGESRTDDRLTPTPCNVPGTVVNERP